MVVQILQQCQLRRLTQIEMTVLVLQWMNGCTESAAGAGYHPLANTDDGSCIAVVLGCTDSTAYSGYNPLANTDDGSCIAVVNGCTDPLYTEYDPLANTNDGSCATLIVNGCTDSTACNYNGALADRDDGSCTCRGCRRLIRIL